MNFHLAFGQQRKKIQIFHQFTTVAEFGDWTEIPKNLKFSKKSEILGFEKISRKLFQFFLSYKMENIISYFKKQVDSAQKAISKYAGQVINLVPEPIRRTVNTVTGNLMTKINEIFENKKKLPPNAVEESSPQQEVVTNKTEIKSTPNETGESSTPQEVITNKTEIKLVESGGRVKVFKTTGNLNFDLTDIIMEKITPIIETRTKVIHAFSCVIYRGQGEIIEYSKTF